MRNLRDGLEQKDISRHRRLLSRPSIASRLPTVPEQVSPIEIGTPRFFADGKPQLVFFEDEDAESLSGEEYCALEAGNLNTQAGTSPKLYLVSRKATTTNGQTAQLYWTKCEEMSPPPKVGRRLLGLKIPEQQRDGQGCSHHQAQVNSRCCSYQPEFPQAKADSQGYLQQPPDMQCCPFHQVDKANGPGYSHQPIATVPQCGPHQQWQAQANRSHYSHLPEPEGTLSYSHHHLHQPTGPQGTLHQERQAQANRRHYWHHPTGPHGSPHRRSQAQVNRHRNLQQPEDTQSCSHHQLYQPTVPQGTPQQQWQAPANSRLYMHQSTGPGDIPHQTLRLVNNRRYSHRPTGRQDSPQQLRAQANSRSYSHQPEGTHGGPCQQAQGSARRYSHQQPDTEGHSHQAKDTKDKRVSRLYVYMQQSPQRNEMSPTSQSRLEWNNREARPPTQQLATRKKATTALPRQLGGIQEHNCCPTVLAVRRNGRQESFETGNLNGGRRSGVCHETDVAREH